MIAVDTNVVVRFLTADEPRQHQRAVDLFRKHPILLPKTVAVECEWVLRSLYRLEPAEIARAFRALLSLPDLQCEDEVSILAGIEALENGLDLADAVHLASARRADGFASFDRRFLREAKKLRPQATVLEP